jgi:hypothetical protein
MFIITHVPHATHTQVHLRLLLISCYVVVKPLQPIVCCVDGNKYIQYVNKTQGDGHAQN